MTSIAVTIAGSDSGGCAGIQADLKSFSANGVYGASVLSALTAQNTLGVTAIHAVPADFVRAQMRAVYEDLKVDATKIGMLSGADVIATVADEISVLQSSLPSGCGPVVLDPVMVAASGDTLLPEHDIQILVERLFPLADLITPNLLEAARVLGQPVADSREAMMGQANALLGLGAQAVLLKGGHGEGDRSTDLLLQAGGGSEAATWLDAPRYPTDNTHGTGCTLSSAIAAGLARGLRLGKAVREAKAYITEAIAAADTLDVGHGHGPVHHFYKFWEADHG